MYRPLSLPSPPPLAEEIFEGVRQRRFAASARFHSARLISREIYRSRFIADSSVSIIEEAKAMANNESEVGSRLNKANSMSPNRINALIPPSRGIADDITRDLLDSNPRIWRMRGTG